MALASGARQEHDANAGALLPHSSSVKTTPRGRARHRSYSDSEGSDTAGSRIRSISGALSEDQASPTPHFRDVLNQKFPPASTKLSSRDEDIAALVDFLNNQAPPPSNYMSIPYDGGSGLGRGKWTKLKMIGKRSKSVPKPQPQIRLPDSAVSGMTTGGHRHIAISIPLEASPFGNIARSQYPVIPPRDDTAARRSHSPSVRTFVNEKGVVSVLRAVGDDRDGSPGYRRSSRSPASFRSQPMRPGTKIQHDQRTKSPPASFSRSQIQDAARAQYRLSRGLSSPAESFYSDADSMFPDTIEEEHDGSSPEAMTPRTFQRSAYPTRFSSNMYNRGMHMTHSIDDIISQRPRKRDSLLNSRDDLNQQLSAEKAAATMSPSIYSSRTDSVADTPASDLTSDIPLAARSGAPSPLRLTSRSRKDLVKDKKRRDMEAARNARLTPQLSDCGSEQPPIPPKAEERALNGHTASHTQNVDEAVGLKSSTPNEDMSAAAPRSRVRLSPVMVVIDEEPSTPNMPATHTERPKSAMASLSSEERNISTSHLACIDESGNPTPPQSNQGSPPQKHNSLNRTSLSRRREWNAVRERERKAREAKGPGRVKIGKFNMGAVSYEPVKADNDIVRLVESHREQRLHEMERRLLRLERNGDVWLRALIPMLENMNQTITSSVRDEEDRGWASDEESDGAVGRRSETFDWDKSDYQAKEKRRRPVSYAPGELLEELARGRGSFDSWADEADDRTGLASLEPLMRELAADVQFRPGTA